MNTTAQIKERLLFTAPGTWVSMALHARFGAAAVMELADAGEGVTVQLRKATDASGTNAADVGDPVTTVSGATNTDITAVAEASADELGEFSAGVPFDFVSATISTAGSPAAGETKYGVLYRGEGRFRP